MSTALPVLAAADTMSDSTFLAYIGALAFSGLLVLIIAALPIGIPPMSRIIDAVIGVAMLGYAFYLFFIFDGGTVRIFLYAFLAPIFAIVQTVKARKAVRQG